METSLKKLAESWAEEFIENEYVIKPISLYDLLIPIEPPNEGVLFILESGENVELKTFYLTPKEIIERFQGMLTEEELYGVIKSNDKICVKTNKSK